jgi:predicted glycoside hydrolase/deacetylase ChbG (UPF0249 family)
MKRLIVNGDDFGLHPLINLGIIEAHQHGILTSTSLVACGSAFDEAVALALKNPSLGVGIHLTFVAERSISPPEQIPSLLGKNNKFLTSWRGVIIRLLHGRIRPEEIRKEAAAQISKVLDAGITPTHVDSHQHLHLLPAFRKVILPLIEQFHIPGIRIIKREIVPQHRGWKSRGLEYYSRRAMSQVKKYGLWCPDFVAGTSLGGHWSLETLRTLLSNLPDGVTEIICHPGRNDTELSKHFDWDYHWDNETTVLTTPDLRALIAKNNIQLCRFEKVEA